MINRKLRRAKKKKRYSAEYKKKTRCFFFHHHARWKCDRIGQCQQRRATPKKKENLGIFVHLPKQDMLVTILLKAVV